MGIFGALTTAVGGLRAESYALENISGNIANSQTTAFKRIDTSFLDLIPSTGLTNQLSGSVTTNSRSTNTVQGDVQAASISTFMAINGSGFFSVQKPGGFTDNSPVFDGVDRYTQAREQGELRKPPAPTAPSLIVLDKKTGRLVASDDARIGPRLLHGQWSSPSLGAVNGRKLVFFGGGDGTCYAFEALSAVIERETAPGAACQSEAAIIDDIRSRAGSVFHPVSTCMMGPDPANAVVDPQLRVHGLSGLRVVDASAFPSVTSGNTNAPTIMLAEKAADIIRGAA